MKTSLDSQAAHTQVVAWGPWHHGGEGLHPRPIRSLRDFGWGAQTTSGPGLGGQGPPGSCSLPSPRVSHKLALSTWSIVRGHVIKCRSVAVRRAGLSLLQALPRPAFSLPGLLEQTTCPGHPSPARHSVDRAQRMCSASAVIGPGCRPPWKAGRTHHRGAGNCKNRGPGFLLCGSLRGVFLTLNLEM